MTWYGILKSKECIYCGGSTQNKKSKLAETKGKPVCDKCFRDKELPQLERFWAEARYWRRIKE